MKDIRQGQEEHVCVAVLEVLTADPLALPGVTCKLCWRRGERQWMCHWISAMMEASKASIPLTGCGASHARPLAGPAV